MSNELNPVSLKAIHIDVLEGSFIFEGTDGRAISWNPRVFLEQLQNPAPLSISPEEADAESDPLVKLSGKLKSLPKEGLPDGSGKPTAWARTAMHQEGHKGAQLFSTTFHGAAREIALGLPVDASINVQGYVHPAAEAGKLPTLSVVRLWRALATRRTVEIN
jgi:hypothetical protein